MPIPKSWRKWLIGLTGAAINSAVSAVGLVVVDPHVFNEWGKLGQMMLVMAVTGAGLYLKTHPIPVDEE